MINLVLGENIKTAQAQRPFTRDQRMLDSVKGLLVGKVLREGWRLMMTVTMHRTSCAPIYTVVATRKNGTQIKISSHYEQHAWAMVAATACGHTIDFNDVRR
jgi:hypothetical protein